MDHADLWSVAVGDDDLTVVVDEVCDCFGCIFCCDLLLRKCGSEGFMSERNDDFFLFHLGVLLV